MQPIFRPRRLAHVNFWVTDWDAAARWHRDIAGLAEAYRRPDIKGVFLSNGNTYHDSAVFDLDTEQGRGKQPGLHHIAFELENEVDLVEGYKRCTEAGFTFDFFLSAEVAHCCYGRDPEGNRFEVYADVELDWREKRRAQLETGTRPPPWSPGATPPVADSRYPKNPPISRIDDAVLHVKKGSHAVLVARDYDVLYRHYTQLVGLTPLVGGPDAPFAILGGTTGEQALAIFAPIPSVESGLHHGSFELMDATDLDGAKEKLAKRGVTVERVVEHPARRAIYVRDPSGNRIQYFVNGSSGLGTLAALPPAEAIWVA